MEQEKEGFAGKSGTICRRLEWLSGALEIPLDFSGDDEWGAKWLELVQGENLMGNLYFNLLGVQHNALVLRDRISSDMLQISGSLISRYRIGTTLETGERKLTRILEQIAALTGLSIDSMTHRDEWNFLVMGRRMERACSTLTLLETLWGSREKLGVSAWELLLRTFDSIMTYRWRYRLQLEPNFVVEMMVKDVTNPRSVSYQCRQIILALQALADEGAPWAIGLSAQVRHRLEKIQRMALDPTTLAQELAGHKTYFLDLHSSLQKILLSA